jgi:hypothetical protein
VLLCYPRMYRTNPHGAALQVEQRTQSGQIAAVSWARCTSDWMMIAYDWIDTQLAGQKDNSVTAASQQYSCITAVQAVQRGMSRAAWGRARRAGHARGKQREWREAQQLRQAGRRAERAAGRAGIRPPMAHRTEQEMGRIGGCGRGLALRASGVLGGGWGEGGGGWTDCPRTICRGVQIYEQRLNLRRS